MTARFTGGVGYVSQPNLTFFFWLVFSSDGSMRMTRDEPSCARDEHRMKMEATLPKSLWKTPALSGKIVLADPGSPPVNVDIAAAQDALRSALGVDIDLRVTTGE